ncbi:unnamed protein product [Adineta steineri]|uniref:NAD(P)(+)--arginine ADP-ribosyltransferase n=1 Tax=Adineta steineri TaxID=433720 RepID=A0A813M5U2_9BILA|nr:unnamed protein product [Adineta steineri]
MENCLVVWLFFSEEEQWRIQEKKPGLQHIIHTAQIFTDTSACLEYLNTVSDEIVFFIVSSKCDEEILTATHGLTQIDSIYLFDISNEFQAELITNYWKVKGIFSEISSLIDQLKKDVRQCENNLTGSVFITSSTSSAESNKQNPNVMYTQLFQQILLRMTDNNLNEMIEYCREKYKDNPFILEEILTIEQQYTGKSSIWWYTKESFLYRMLNKALRIQDIDTIYAIRTYIRHLHEQLVQLYSKSDSCSTTTLYRGQLMTNSDFEELKQNQGGLLFFSNFLSFSENLSVAKTFANNNSNDPTKTGVIFALQANHSPTNNVAFANIHQYSCFEDEKEWLFSIGSIFHIGWRMKFNNDGIWYVKLNLTNERNLQSLGLARHISNFIKSQNLLIELGKLMWEMGEYEQTEKFYRKALETEDDWRCRSGILNRLGMIYWKKNEIEQALHFYQQALTIDRQHLPENDPSMSSIYNNLGLLYRNQGKLNEARENFQRACQLDLNSIKPKKEWLGSYYNNMASVFAAEENHSKALFYHNKAFKIRREVLPSKHPLIALSHNNIAISLMRLNRLSEAFEHCRIAVNIASQSLPAMHEDTILYQENLEFIRQSMQSKI